MVKLRGVLLSIVPALLFSSAFHPINLWWLAFVAYALLIQILHRYHLPWMSAFAFGFISSLVVLSWSKTYVGVLPWLLLSILQGLYFLPVAFIAHRCRNIAATLTSLLLMDSLKAIFPFGGFGWMRFGFTQADSPLAIFYPYLGVVGVTALSLFVISAAFSKKISHAVFLLFIAIFAHLTYAPFVGEETLRIRAVQGGVPERGLQFNARAQAVLDQHISQTVSTIQKGDELILWPENAVDVDPELNTSAAEKLQKLQRLTGVPLLAGVITGRDKSYNSAILYSSKADIESIYRKRYLTPFGEYIPFRSLASKISPHVERVDDFLAGDALVVHNVKGIPIASIICYELLSDSIVRESASKSSIFAVMTNSATFAGSSEGLQQLQITRIRAMESQRYAISVSTTGPSALVDPRGRVLTALNDGEVGSISSEIPVMNQQTWESRYGAHISLFILFFSLVIILRSALQRSKGRNTHE